MTLRVHLADDHAMFRQGLAAILSSREGIEVVGQSGTGPGAGAMVARTRPDVIVMQLDMELKEAERVLGSLRQSSPSSKVVVLTLWDSPRYLAAVSEMGIDALLHKSATADELVAVVTVASLDPEGSNVVLSLPRSILARMDGGLPHGLTQREVEVVLLAARGLSNRQIAEELYVADATVKRHLANVYEKIGVSSRNGAVRKAIMEEWIGIHEITGAAGSAD